MAKKLGEILVGGKLLTPSDLKRALDAQLIFGGRLGTNLLELGFLDEGQLTAALKEQKRLEVATVEMLEKASAEALRALPAKVADRHKAVPFLMQDRKLRVAMVDPTDLIALDELAFVSGCSVTPFLCPEVRLLTYLEKYYGITRPLRYIKLARMEPTTGPRLDAGALAAEFTSGVLDPTSGGRPFTAVPVASPSHALPPSSAEDVAPVGEQVLSISDLLGGPADAGAAPAPGAPAAAGAGKQQDLDAVVEQVKKAREQAAREAEAAASKVTLADAAAMLAQAETREDIGDALLAYARTQFPRVLTFVVQKDRALGWQAQLPGMTAEQARQHARGVALPLDQPSVLQGVVESGTYYMGELPARPGDQALAAALGGARPAALLILPVKVSDRVILVLYGDANGQPLGTFDMRALRSLTQKAAQAMDVLLLRSQIRQV